MKSTITAAMMFGICVFWGEGLVALGQDTPAQPPVPVVGAGDEAAQAQPPHLQLSSEEWDFGMKWYGEPCATEITITNTGASPLKILKIRSSCGCTALKPKRKELLPGESDTMSLTYNTKKNKEQVSQTVTLETNDPERPRVSIKVKGIVKKVYEAKPIDRITFGRISRDEVASQTVELRNNMENPVPLKLKQSDTALPFEVALVEVEAGKVYKLTVTTKPPLELGSNSANIELETGLEKFPSITIPASAYIAPQVFVRPSRLFVSPQITQSFQRTVRVHYQTATPVQIKEIKTIPADLIKIEMLPSTEPKNPQARTHYHEFRVTLPAGPELPEDGARIEIYTDNPSPDYKMLVVEVKLRKPVPRMIGTPPVKPKLDGEAPVPDEPVEQMDDDEDAE